MFPENDRKVFRLRASVCVSVTGIRMGKDQAPKKTRLPEKTANNSKELLSGLRRGSEKLSFQLSKERKEDYGAVTRIYRSRFDGETHGHQPH